MTINRVEYLDPHKQNQSDKIYWLSKKEQTVGDLLFSFDLKKIYNLHTDYPHNLTVEEKDIFDKENPFWVKFFSVT